MPGGSHRSSAERRLLQLLHGRQTRVYLREIHAHSLRHHLHQSNVLLAHFVSVCSSLGRLPYAHLVFLQAHAPNLLLFNAAIKAHSLSAPTSLEALHVFSLMRSRGIFPDRFTFAPLLKSCSNLSDLSLGRAVHAEVVVYGLEMCGPIRVGLVELYSGCGRMRDARQVFDMLPCDDVVLWNLMIHGFCESGDLDSGYRLFRRMDKRNVVTWNTMIGGLAHCGRDSKALELFQEMWVAGTEPEAATLVTIFPVCARLGAVDVGRWIHAYADRRGLSREVVNVGNSMVDMYCKCGDVESASAVFSRMPRKNVVSWNAMIVGLAFNGKGEEGIATFERMKSQGVAPNGVTYIGVLGCCTHAGLVRKGQELFDSMINSGIKTKLEHYGCMVDVLGRGGYLKEALELIHGMPMKPSAAIWGSLLSSSRIHSDLEVAEHAVKELINIEPLNSGNYVLLSNIYSETGRWEESEKVRLLMKEKCILKSPGQSSLD